jgi:murein DD-endopeptidase MepM/ murein hydrolase activator NlpD
MAEQNLYGVAMHKLLIALLVVVAAGCTLEQPRIIVITSTPELSSSGGILPLSQPPLGATNGGTADNTVLLPVDQPEEHTVQPGDTLSRIAQQYGTTVAALIAENNLVNPDIIEVGQIIRLPSAPTSLSPSVLLLPDILFVRGPLSSSFDVQTFISQQPGYLSQVTDTVTTNTDTGAGFDETLTSWQIIERISLEYSVDARLLLSLLEMKSGLLSNPTPDSVRIMFPVIGLDQSLGINRSGLYRQLAYVANELNRGYYGYKTRGLRVLEFQDGTRFQINPALNPATIGVQYFLSRNQAPGTWLAEVSANGQFAATYTRFFGTPVVDTAETLVPENLVQPELTLPFAPGETWLYTGGPHGGWGSGSAWASLDFAPPDERPPGTGFCYVSITPIRAVASGKIVRSGNGTVILDLDGDMDEGTGWTIVYLHLSSSIGPGETVAPGDVLGTASCAGGFSSATHLHIGRKYNGEWIPADCSSCIPGFAVTPFTMSGWSAESIAGQEYQGYLVSASARRQAEQGRATTINQVSW